jgi:hypothetical protein
MNVVRMRSSKGNATNDISTVALAVLVGLASVPFQKISYVLLVCYQPPRDLSRLDKSKGIKRYQSIDVAGESA